MLCSNLCHNLFKFTFAISFLPLQVNDMFDIMNTRSLDEKRPKKPVSKTDIAWLRQFDDLIQFVQSWSFFKPGDLTVGAT